MKDQITYLPDNADRSVAKQKFKITNWPTYNKALINRGSITFWLDDEAIQAWYESATPSSRGRPQRYSDLAITTVLVIKRVFRLTLRAAQGFIDSIFTLMNVPLRCPDYTSVSKRAKSVPCVSTFHWTTRPVNNIVFRVAHQRMPYAEAHIKTA